MPWLQLTLTCIGWFTLAALAPAGEKGVTSGNYGGNSQRTGYVDQALAPPYQLQWVHVARHKPRPAWSEPIWEPQRIDFDYAHAVSAQGEMVFYASSADHALHALDADTGLQRWQFITEGPVRLAAEFYQDRVLFGSDDGRVYCLEAASGKLVWKFVPEIPDNRLIGNEQMISRFPARSGVVVDGDRIYTTFGMLSPEGVAVCCLDARTGKPLWTNDTCGYRYMARPHSMSMAGVSPQGYLAVNDKLLIVPCGRNVPALFDKQTGECRYHDGDGDFTGGSWTMVDGDLVFTPAETLRKEYGPELTRGHGDAEADVFELAGVVALDAKSGEEVFTLLGGNKAILSPQGQMTLTGRGKLVSCRLGEVRQAIGKKTTIAHTYGHFIEAADHALWSTPVDRVYTLLQAGDTILAGGRGCVAAYDARNGHELWTATVDGQARAMCIVPGGLIVSTTEGKIYHFRTSKNLAAANPAIRTATITPIAASAAAQKSVDNALQASNVTEGYALVLGTATAETLSELANRSKLTIYHGTRSPQAEPLRNTLEAAGLYGTRVAVHQLATTKLPYTDYFADAIYLFVADAKALSEIDPAEVARVLRPCGGVAWLPTESIDAASVDRWLASFPAPAYEVRSLQGGALIRRGAMKGAGQWTHQYGDAGRRCASDETLVRLPLKAAWFGGLGPATIVSRHFREPAPLVIEGRCFVPGTDHLTAMNLYNGRVLWQRRLPELAHWPQGYRGPSVVVDRQFVYALQGPRCLKLDPQNGTTVGEYAMPLDKLVATPQPKDLIWEYLAVVDDYVVGTIGQANLKPEWWSKAYPVNYQLFAINKKDGQVAWTYTPKGGVDSNAIAIAEGKVLLIDGRPQYPFATIEKPSPTRGKRRMPDDEGAISIETTSAPAATPRELVALDLVRGTELWRVAGVRPTQNSLWTHRGVVLSTLMPYSREMQDPGVAKAGGGVTAYATTDGKKLWQIDEVKTLVPMIVDDVAYLPQGYDLHSGKPLRSTRDSEGQRTASLPFICSTLSGCPTLAMARAGSLGFRDLDQQTGTFQYSVVRPSCWINMIPAGGLVVVPEGSSSCTCAYNYKMSLGLISDDRHFHYGLAKFRAGERFVCRVNFGAGGDRPDAQGDVWFAYPRPVAYGRTLGNQPYGRKTADAGLPLTDADDKPVYHGFARHPDWLKIDNTTQPWLYACGIEGPARLTFKLGKTRGEHRYRVTLHFCELDESAPARQFDVQLQDKTVLTDFNVAREAGGPRRALSKSFSVTAGEAITLGLNPKTPPSPPPILNGLTVEEVP